MDVKEFMKYVMIADEKCSIYVNDKEVEEGYFDDIEIRVKYSKYKVELISYSQTYEKWMMYFKN